MVPAAMSASCAFMLPVATAPNSVVYRQRPGEYGTHGARGLCPEPAGCGGYQRRVLPAADLNGQLSARVFLGIMPFLY